MPGRYRSPRGLECRSIQVSRERGVLTYPAFAARITRAKDGRLLLGKTGGSQLRRGFLHPAGPNRRVFLGQKRVRGEPAGEYSQLYPPDQVDGETVQNDSVGVLTRKKDGRLLLILDVSAAEYEIYELARRAAAGRSRAQASGGRLGMEPALQVARSACRRASPGMWEYSYAKIRTLAAVIADGA